MKRILFTLSIFLLLPQLVMAQTDLLSTSDQLTAEAVMNQYFDALAQGDTNAIKTMISGKLLKKRSRLLDNPTYPDHLRNLYQNAQFDISGYETIDGNKIVVDVAIKFKDQDTLQRRFLLMREQINNNNPTTSFYIIDEM